jgi:hypothetical protein
MNFAGSLKMCASTAVKAMGMVVPLAVFTLGLSLATAQATQMEFFAEPPTEPVEIFGNAWTVYASGPIDPMASERLAALITKNNIPSNSTVYFHSPGGSVVAAMSLGRLIRKHHLFTDVGARGRLESGRFARYESLPGHCLSACSLSYLGGVFRWKKSESIYGVHRVWGNASFDADAAQIASSVIVQYIREMGADPELFSEMTVAGREEINALPQKRLEALGVTNNGFEKPRWTIESTASELYLKGERNTWHGINKFLLVCAKGTISLYVIFDPIGRGQEVLSMSAKSLMLDGKAIPIDQLQLRATQIVNGWINAEFRLTPALIGKIQSARAVGVAFQFAHGAPMFMGFDGMEMDAGRQKLSGLLAICR